MIALSALVAFSCASGCVFGPGTHKGVVGYRNGRVFVRHDKAYRVGLLPEGWERMKSSGRTVSFYNPNYRSSISTDAFCGRGASDRKLDALGGEIASALEKRTLVSERPMELSGRGALRQTVEGSLDGVPVVLDLVVVRKDGCVFDFYSVSPPGADPRVAADFEAFFGEFSYE